MSDVQLENGYTKISNELIEKIPYYKFNGSQLRILIVVLRYTYGFNRKEHSISLGFLSNATGISRNHIKEDLDILIGKGVIISISEPTFKSSRIVSFNKNYEEWKMEYSPLKRVQPPKEGIVQPPKKGTPQSPKKGTKKETLKENSKETIVHIEEYFNKCWKMYPKKEGKASVKDKQKKVLFDLGDEFIRTIERYKDAKSDKDSQYLQMGSTFFNSGYVDYLDKAWSERDVITKAEPTPEEIEAQRILDEEEERIKREVYGITK